MNVKLYLIFLVLSFFGIQIKAQSCLGLSIGVSKNDNHIETLWYQYQASKRFSAGLQLRYSDIRYRFVNARAIEEGKAIFIGTVLGFNINRSEKYRLDFNLTASYRYLNNNENPELPASTNGLEIDPNIIFGIRLSDNIFFNSGAMFRMAMQFGDEPISDEQTPTAAIVLNGISYQKNTHNFSLRVYSGPMTGATGDTEKFFWQVSFGYQYVFGTIQNNALPFFNF